MHYISSTVCQSCGNEPVVIEPFKVKHCFAAVIEQSSLWNLG